ncbi:MAG: NAD(P)-binding domain-containing protein, partial [SAR202 cluster bacterium]|nr:NAD(P)-binding domain-containing protein [SAR202 cluster bacterium]
MLIETVGAVGIGDMGGAVAAALKSNGLRVMTVLEGRSERSRFLASDHGLEDAGSIAGLVEECDLILSILAPATGPAVAKSVADCLSESGGDVVFADCNAVSPQTSIQMARTISDAGGQYVDGGI